MERKNIPEAENRLLILYAMECLGPVTDEQLLRFMTELDLMNYFTLQLALSEMQEQGDVVKEAHPLGSLLSLSESGRFTLRGFEARVPMSRRETVNEAAAVWRTAFRREQQTPAEIRRLPDGQHFLRLWLLESGTTLLDLLYTLPRGENLVRVRERWLAACTGIYSGLLGALMSGPAEAAAELPEGVMLEHRSAGDWLLSLTGGTDTEPMFILLSLPDEAAARLCAANWPGAAEALRIMIGEAMRAPLPEDA